METAALGITATPSAGGSSSTGHRRRKGASKDGLGAEEQPRQRSIKGIALPLAGAAAGLVVALLGRALRGGRHRRQAAELAPLVSLPADILAHILQLLSIEDRLSLRASCRRLRQVSEPLLWRDSSVALISVGHVQEFAQWLAAPRPYMRRLKVFAAFLNPELFPNPMDYVVATVQAGGVLAAAVAAVPSLEALSWDVGRSLAAQLARWARPGALPLLRSLILICRHQLEVPRELRRGLPALRELRILEDVVGTAHNRVRTCSASGISLAGRCLPAGLQQLEILAAGKFKLPRATIAGCTQLTELSVSCCGKPVIVPESAVLQLRSLRRLRVGECAPSVTLLGSLAQLPELTALGCSSVLSGWDHSVDGGFKLLAILQALLALAASPPARLRELNLGGLQLPAVPTALLGIRTLEVLLLDGNPSITFVAEQADLAHCSLRHVTLDESAVRDNLQALRWMPELSELHLASSDMESEDAELAQSVQMALQGAVAVRAGPGPHISMNLLLQDTLRESSPDVWGPKLQAHYNRLAEGRKRVRASERAAVVGQGVVGAAVGAATGAAVHFAQRVCMR